MVPTHQGRGAEHVLMNVFVKPGDRVLGNMHFDTTEGHILLRGAEPVNCLAEIGTRCPKKPISRVTSTLAFLRPRSTRAGEKVPFILITVTCNKQRRATGFNGEY